MNKSNNAPPLKILLPLLAAIIAISPLAIDMYLPAMPILAKALNTDISMVQNTLSIYLLGYALGLLFFGPLADQYARRKLVFIGIIGFSLINLILPFVETIEQFLSLRFLQAFISSAATVVVPGTIREYYGKNTAKGLSYVSMIMMLAPMIAPSIGSILLVLHSWQLIFFVLAGYSLLVLLFTIKYLPEKKILAAKHVSFLARYKIVLSSEQARFDLITSMVVSLAFFAYITAIPFVYLTVFSVSEMMFSVLFALNVLGLMSAHFINTRLVTRKGSRVMLRWGLTVAIISAMALVAVSYWQLPIIYTVLTISPLMGSISMIAVNSDALVLNQFTQQSGTATAVIGTLRFGIGALAGPILAWFYDGTALPFATLMFTAIFIVFLCQLRVKLQSNKEMGQ
ncbi:MAG: DHA1 family bicyclomycin/chloramphenicol resistance-like MFS transporter [Alteromonadaceae bacterium]